MVALPILSLFAFGILGLWAGGGAVMRQKYDMAGFYFGCSVFQFVVATWWLCTASSW